MMFLINMDDFTSRLCMAQVHTKIKQNWVSGREQNWSRGMMEQNYAW